MKVAVVSANFGDYDPVVAWVPQVVADGISVTVHRFDDASLPPRPKAMSPALRAGIPKMCGFELVPGADVYVWIDASRGLLRPDTVAWFLDHLGKAEMLLFLHPGRHTIRDEYEFVKAKLAAKSRYLTSRYGGEWLDEQYAAVNHQWYRDDRLYASTAFAYRPTPKVKQMLRAWFFHKARYLLHDQLALPYLVRQNELRIVERPESIYAFEHLPMTRT